MEYNFIHPFKQLVPGWHPAEQQTVCVASALSTGRSLPPMPPRVNQSCHTRAPEVQHG